MWKKIEKMNPDEQTAYYLAWFRELRFLAILGLFIFTFYSSCFQPHRVPTGSMVPTIMIGDYILVDKAAYGLKFPFTEYLDSPWYLTPKTSPERGEVVVFRYPENPRLNYIKRIVGVPGDRIEMKNYEWIVNGEIYALTALGEPAEKENIEKRFFESGLEEFLTQTGNFEHKVLLSSPPKSPGEMNEIVLKADQYFMVGDNRDHSLDSRHWGVVDRSAIRGKALLVWFSLVSPFSGEKARIKKGRIGTELHLWRGPPLSETLSD